MSPNQKQSHDNDPLLRHREIKQRNCVTVASSIKDTIVRAAMSAVLAEVNKTPRGWNRGGAVQLSDLCASLDRDILKQLKKECGGVQTLLRNHWQLFVGKAGEGSLSSFSILLACVCSAQQ